ncbi:hypothetical protein SBA5_560051 [Candidatus Sulfotelmatomonas gaucii]|uniref:Uncharacterized protein n=1 Tax=Candidatus Sulfuritelmatomonas gaucii TaxID=2043161 RepID=A0A2N9LUR7_9BACT|nr:hypothetical protein SBA5_560051 [Candidatus Sulfotelmatomonas gaucii]
MLKCSRASVECLWREAIVRFLGTAHGLLSGGCGDEMPGHVDADRDLVFDGHGEERRTLDFEVGTGERNGSGDTDFPALLDALERDLGVVGRLAGELDFEVGVNPLLRDLGLRNAGAYLDEGKLGAARGFDHVQIAVGVARVKGLDRDGDEEVAPAGVTDSFAAGGVADAVNLVHGMRHVIGEGGLAG